MLLSRYGQRNSRTPTMMLTTLQTGMKTDMDAASPKPMSPETLALLRRPNFAHLATIRPDGSPKLDPIWIEVLDESTVAMATGRASLKTQNILNDPRVAISVIDMDNPYEEAQLRGVAQVEPDPAMATMDQISHKYTSQPFPMRDNIENRVVLRVTVTHSRYASLPFKHTPPDNR